MLTKANYEHAGVILGILSASLPDGHLTMQIRSDRFVIYQWRYVIGEQQFGWQHGLDSKRFRFQVSLDVERFAQDLVRDMRHQYDNANQKVIS